jgi:mannose-6-phosphate isomerase-like protein (cupin superfamily)
MSGSHTTREGEGEVIDLGMATMRLLAPSEVTSGGFTLSEFTGGEGPWSVVHIHERFEESFLVLEGRFTFVAGDEEIEADPGTYVLVKRGTPHTIVAHDGGGRLLLLAVPGGHEAMFRELAGLGPQSLRDPKIRAEVSTRHDSVPVQK